MVLIYPFHLIFIAFQDYASSREQNAHLMN